MGINCNCGKDVEKIVEKVFHKKNEFSTEKLSINFINDWKKNKKNIVLELKKEREKLGNFGVLKKIANYLLKK